jgi:hypothetical protein
VAVGQQDLALHDALGHAHDPEVLDDPARGGRRGVPPVDDLVAGHLPIIARGEPARVKVVHRYPDGRHMTRLPRVAPTPAAVVTYVALGTFALMYALISSYDILEQVGAGEWAWPTDPATMVRDSAGWAAQVALWSAVAWVAGRRSPRRVVALAAAVVGVWCLLAWWSAREQIWGTGWYVPWPGPVSGVTWEVPTGDPDDVRLSAELGVVTPVALVAALAVTSWLAHRRSQAEPPAARTSSPRARRTALAVLALPVVAALTGATLLQLAPADDGWTPAQNAVNVLVSPAFALTLAAGAALLLGGRGRAGWVLLGLVGLAAVGPLVHRWLLGDEDDLLGTAALGTLAVALAAAVHPVAAALTRLDDPPPVVEPSVPERADAHH